MGLDPGRGKTKVQAEKRFSEYDKAKTKAKISDTQAHRWQQLAALPDPDAKGP
jgi:hypothetical protein